MPAPDWLIAGHVGRPHGLDGSFHVVRARPGLLSREHPVRVGERESRIERLAGTDERPILRVSLAASREAVTALRGEDLLVPQAAAPPLGEDEWHASELEGLTAVDGTTAIGTVTALLALPSCEVLEVARPGRDPLLVPLVADAVRSVDLERGVVDVDLAFLGEAD